GIRYFHVTGVQTCALPICLRQLGRAVQPRERAVVCPGASAGGLRGDERDGLPLGWCPQEPRAGGVRARRLNVPQPDRCRRRRDGICRRSLRFERLQEGQAAGTVLAVAAPEQPWPPVTPPSAATTAGARGIAFGARLSTLSRSVRSRVHPLPPFRCGCSSPTRH